MPWDWNKNQPYGIFKKILLTKEELVQEKENLKLKLLELQNKYQEQSLSSPEIAFEFFWIYYSYRNRKNLFNTSKKVKVSVEDPIQFLEKIRFRKIPDTIRITLLNWLLKKWNIKLLDYNPTSYEMLEFQSKGIRIVTIDFDSALNCQFVFEIRDAFEHFLHDLEHCYNFYNKEELYFKQIEFFKYLLNFYPEVEILLNIDLDFKRKWDYLISDMNSHPEHLKQYTKAIFYEVYKKNLNIKDNVIKKMEQLLMKL